MESDEPPFMLRVTAALYLVVGASSLAAMLVDLLTPGQTTNLNLNLLAIPFGRILIDRRRDGWWWALFLVGLPFIAFIIALARAIWLGSVVFPPTMDDYGSLFVLLILGGAVISLCRPSTRAWYRSESLPGKRGEPWAIPVILAGFVAGFFSATETQNVRQSVAEIFAAHTEFICVDETTGQPLEHLGGGPEYTFSSSRPSVIRFESGQQGHMIVSGLAYHPFDVVITAPDRPSVRYELNAKSPREVTLEFGPPAGK